MLLVCGMTNAQIAQRLEVTIHTVKAHRADLMRRTEAGSFAKLVSRIHCLYPAESVVGTAPDLPLKVIVVEDDLWYREYLTENLRARGFAVVGVVDLQGFRTAWARQPADIVMFDIDLGAGKEDGLTIARELRKVSRCGIVMVTAKGELDDRLAGLGIGADAYFSKPVVIDELVVVLINLGRRLR